MKPLHNRLLERRGQRSPQRLSIGMSIGRRNRGCLARIAMPCRPRLDLPTSITPSSGAISHHNKTLGKQLEVMSPAAANGLCAPDQQLWILAR